MSKRIFKKYPNRRLYDTKNSCYVNLDAIKDAVLTMEPVEVIDVQTSKDITPSILLQIINKQQNNNKQSSLMTSQTLHNLILLYNTPYGLLFNQFLENATAWLTSQQNLATNKKKATNQEKNANPFTVMPNGLNDFSKFSNNIQDSWNEMIKSWIK